MLKKKKPAIFSRKKVPLPRLQNHKKKKKTTKSTTEPKPQLP